MSELSATNNYRLDVVANNLVDPVGGEQYALVVSYLSIPEPSTVALTGTFALVVWVRRRWLRHRETSPSGASLTVVSRRASRHTAESRKSSLFNDELSTSYASCRSVPTAAELHDIYTVTTSRPDVDSPWSGTHSCHQC